MQQLKCRMTKRVFLAILEGRQILGKLFNLNGPFLPKPRLLIRWGACFQVELNTSACTILHSQIVKSNK
ncbi:hypothetical protein T10_3384 [Trichinella papuae]|uniref:Uncharacterized protein n=1 Tax=Trichinella papuae TaxID=268474 RepID=A0A0V1N935_9BILA|nr:hypothetical protein T10_3384 [Trichinella papuae]